MDVDIDAKQNLVTLTLKGPSSVWYGVGFGSEQMSGAYSVCIDGTGNIEERKLVGVTAGNLLTSTFEVQLNEVEDSTRTVILTRAYNMELPSTDHYEFDVSDSKLKIIWAYGTTSDLQNHGEDKRDSDKISMSRTEASTGQSVHVSSFFRDSKYVMMYTIGGLLFVVIILASVGFYKWKKNDKYEYTKLANNAIAQEEEYDAIPDETKGLVVV
jgi:hypothetical protein